ncbi:3-ketoacyl-CoA thiolase [Ephemerocybe angulata]|uniref:3-ketoacyl-CoA thiolase n=1 Tax=Ephemerocybe angulata TaxID=980116 RepID=A0A8H6ME28_9AGAR|nr:3-ketoacyl-CoA thiolase [Tulosesus angulatus]
MFLRQATSRLVRPLNAPLLRRYASSNRPQGLAEILQKNPDDVVITYAKRTAIGRAFKGQYKDIPVDEILHALFKAALADSKLDPAKIDDICVGTCHPPSPLYISRAAALAAGIPPDVPISTVNRLCSSGLMAVRNIAHHIKAGEALIGVAAAAESMSNNPRPSPEVVEHISAEAHANDCIQPMGWTSERVADNFNVSRERQDEAAFVSHSRASRAVADGIFAEEIIPVSLRGKTVTTDDTVRPGVTLEKLKALKPAFPQWEPSTTTAGNASGIGDGAGLVILTTRENAEKEGMPILGKWVSSTVVGVAPRYMGISPAVAIPKLLKQVGLSKEEVDIYEINEAFASQFVYCLDELDIPIDKVNPNGGAIAISHPVGMTGIRQIITGLAELRRRNERVLCTSMCIGSGMGAASIVVNETIN